MTIDQMFLDPLSELGTEGLVSWLNAREKSWSDDEFLDPAPADAAIVSALAMGLKLTNFPRPNNDSVATTVVDFWERLSMDDVSDPLVRARAARNLWLTKSGASPFESAQLSIQGLSELAIRPDSDPRQRSTVAEEALELALSLGATDVLEELIALHWQLVEEFKISSDGHDPACFDKYQAGLTLGPDGARDLLEATRESSDVLEERRFHDSWHRVLESISTVRASRKWRSLVDESELIDELWEFVAAVEDSEILSRAAKRVLEQIVGRSGPTRERYVRWWIAIEQERAANREPMAHWAILSELERLARDEGLVDLVTDLQLQIQSLDPKSSLAVNRTEFSLPPEVKAWFTARLARIRAAEDIGMMLDAILIEGLRIVPDSEGLTQRSSFLDSFQSIQIGHEGATARIIPAVSSDGDSDSSRSERSAAREFAMRTQLEIELVLAPALQTLFGSFDHQAITDHIAHMAEGSGLLDPTRARRASEAIEQFASESYDLCAHALVPRIEYAIRQTAKQLGVAVIRGTDGTSRGGHISLNQVLGGMRGKISEEVRKHLEWTLTSDLAANLRNDIAHGDVTEVEQGGSALLIHAFLLTIQPEALRHAPEE